MPGADALPAEILTSGYQFSKYCLPGEDDLTVTLLGDTPSVEKRSLTPKKAPYDLGASVNPWDVSLKFKRATGILTGKLSIWTETADGFRQKEIKGLSHEGVLLLSREGDGPLSEKAWTAGYYIVPTSLSSGGKIWKWKCSLPFNVLTEYVGWSD